MWNHFYQDVDIVQDEHGLLAVWPVAGDYVGGRSRPPFPLWYPLTRCLLRDFDIILAFKVSKIVLNNSLWAQVIGLFQVKWTTIYLKR